MCKHAVCLEDAFQSAVENFELAKGFGLHDLPLTWDGVKQNEVVDWDSITRGTDFIAAHRYFRTVAEEYLASGITSCREEA